MAALESAPSIINETPCGCVRAQVHQGGSINCDLPPVHPSLLLIILTLSPPSSISQNAPL